MEEIYTDSIGLEYRVHPDCASNPDNQRWVIQVRLNMNTDWHTAVTFNFTPLDSFYSKETAEKYLIKNIERIL